MSRRFQRCKFSSRFIDLPPMIDPVIIFGEHGYFCPGWMPKEIAWAIAEFRKGLTPSGKKE